MNFDYTVSLYDLSVTSNNVAASNSLPVYGSCARKMCQILVRENSVFHIRNINFSPLVILLFNPYRIRNITAFHWA